MLLLSTVATAAPVWPTITRENKPWTYWWWMGSAMDKTNLTRELQRYQDAGLGGVHIIPIYGAKGYENRFIDYLNPQWMQMLAHTVSEAQRLDMGVDMTMGTGWCFGGPHVTDQEANASVVVRKFELAAGDKLTQMLNPTNIQALVAFSPEGENIELSGKLDSNSVLDWSPKSGSWVLYAISQRPSGQKVKRAAPGGQGHMLNLFYPEAMRHYLEWFDDAFAQYHGPNPRALYHDSYEYRSDWAPDLFASFEKRRGYRLQTELPALFAGDTPSYGNQSRITNLPSVALAEEGHPSLSPDHVARVKSDYRETISDVMAEESLPLWTEWARRNGFLTRNEAHGSPGNWLDLYSVADIPETEMFYKDRNRLVSKFASSAGHVTGKNLIAAETGTWLKEHFTETLADMKYLVDDMFLSGINHIVYHGTCYSPDEAGWPGWHFYASYEMNPRNSIWRDVPTLNTYVARCQAVLQSGRPDNDILLYWPIYDVWHNPSGRAMHFTIHARDWFEEQPIGKTAQQLWNRGYAFDYISDRQLSGSKVVEGKVKPGGGEYSVVVLPRTEHIPVKTLQKVLELTSAGATIVFQDALPADVPGWGHLDERRARLRDLLTRIQLADVPGTIGAKSSSVRTGRLGKGRVFVGDLEAALTAARVTREAMFDHPGLFCFRRAVEGGHDYFIANRSEQRSISGWVPIARFAKSATIMEPLTGQIGMGAVRRSAGDVTETFLELAPGASLILQCRSAEQDSAPAWKWWEVSGQPVVLGGTWRVNFLDGGPESPSAFQTSHLVSWTELGDTNAQRFAGTARYTLTFDAPTETADQWQLDLGQVRQSARIRLNGESLGTLITPPFRVTIGRLKPKNNQLEIEVTNVSANRIRDLDRRGVKWKNFYDINFVNLDYKPFDASGWPLTPSGLLGPVRLTSLSAVKP